MSTVFLYCVYKHIFRVELFVIEFCYRRFIIDFAKIQPLSVLSRSILVLRTLTAVCFGRKGYQGCPSRADKQSEADFKAVCEEYNRIHKNQGIRVRREYPY